MPLRMCGFLCIPQIMQEISRKNCYFFQNPRILSRQLLVTYFTLPTLSKFSTTSQLTIGLFATAFLYVVHLTGTC